MSTKSVILAPFNSTKSHFSSFNFSRDDEVFQWNEILRLGAKCREVDWQYENNNNSKLDNGVYNKFANNSANHSEDTSWESQYIDPGFESRTEKSWIAAGNGDSIDKSFWEDVTARSIEKDVDK